MEHLGVPRLCLGTTGHLGVLRLCLRTTGHLGVPRLCLGTRGHLGVPRLLLETRGQATRKRDCPVQNGTYGHINPLIPSGAVPGGLRISL
ncbi:hypothetical protein AVEN_10649-1 [Araneus ventricosus]|uniref:Uncharacterized protein n=1 Tax=Araneus ventricosus TaxID=182803 RepID=A0A4Y2L8N7_ARAVE|nr:hypothetical protein AVEN_10649-1 [Araneus ventricosus]